MKIAFPAIAQDHSNPLKNKKLIGNYLIKHLEIAGNEIEIFNVKEPLFQVFYYKAKKLIYKFLFKKNHLREREYKFLKGLSKKVSKQINQSDCDCVFAFGSMPVAFLNVNIPIYFLTDATFHNLQDFYETYSNLSKSSIKDGNYCDKEAFRKAKKIFFSSNWAAQDAINFYKVPKEKIEIVPLGDNMDYAPKKEHIFELIQNRTLDAINLVGIGKQWYRKGFDRNIEILEELIKEGVDAKLTLIGSEVPLEYKNRIENFADKIQIINFLDKNVPEDLDKFEDILKEANFLLFLSRAETFGHVVSEANAYGLPVIASRIGGIPSAVRNQINGILFDENKLISEIVHYLKNIKINTSEYFELCKNSREEYDSRLNWDFVISEIKKNIKS